MIKVLFVCTGNICRSPTAEGFFQHLLNAQQLSEHVHLDSAGTHNYHVGEPPDGRAIRAAKSHGIDISHLRARQLQQNDFSHFDYILAMDDYNINCIEKISPHQPQAKVSLFLEYAPSLQDREVPDPYYGEKEDYERVIQLVQAASAGLIEEIKNHLS